MRVNLELIPALDNSIKGACCSITKESLLTQYSNYENQENNKI